ncbi:MAG TPA: nucleotidyltransferase domain-containing protein [Bacteroidia bacterium]|jgi:predicted nucleotidyltransferase|nr:nucleotidyltransferase domain-containing protein [Bacteroidia bacterium]
MNNTLQKIIAYTVQVADPDKLILFGSMSKGNITPNSDVDLLIISEDVYIKREIQKMIGIFCNEFSLKADILFYSAEEVEREQRKPHSFLGAILKDGKVVYEK